MSDRRRPTPITPLHDSLAVEFARRELTDTRLAYWPEVFSA
jgi:hypothetical protein